MIIPFENNVVPFGESFANDVDKFLPNRKLFEGWLLNTSDLNTINNYRQDRSFFLLRMHLVYNFRGES